MNIDFNKFTESVIVHVYFLEGFFLSMLQKSESKNDLLCFLFIRIEQIMK